MNDNRYYNYLKGYVLGSLAGQKKAGFVDATRTEREHLLVEGVDVFLDLALRGYCEDNDIEELDDEDYKEWCKQTTAYIEEMIERELTERELGAYYGLI